MLSLNLGLGLNNTRPSRTVTPEQINSGKEFFETLENLFKEGTDISETAISSINQEIIDAGIDVPDFCQKAEAFLNAINQLPK